MERGHDKDGTARRAHARRRSAPAETITAVRALVGRLDTDRWDPSALDPASLNAQAAALGPQYNIFQVGTTIKPTAPAFLRYRAASYLRPFDLAPGGR